MLFFADSGERRGRPGDADRLGRRRDRRRCCCCSASSTTRTGRRLGGLEPVGDGAHARASSSRQRRSSAAPGRCRATRTGPLRDERRDRERRPAGSRSSRRSCSPSRPSPPRGAATRHRWNGEQAKAASRANATRIEAARASASRTADEVDVATFIQWVDAYAREETELADFYRERFRAEFKPAFEAWIATRPLKKPDAPLTPFAMPEYQLAATSEAERLEARRRPPQRRRGVDIQRASNYVLGVVLFALSLFFAGISTKLHRGRRAW